MSTTVIKGSDLLPEIIARLHLSPEKVYEIREQREDEEEDMPPEEMISDALIESVKRSEADHKAGRFTRCRTKEEREAHYKKVLDE